MIVKIFSDCGANLRSSDFLYNITLVIYTQNKLVCEKWVNQHLDFEYNEDTIFLKKIIDGIINLKPHICS
jgi:hypothetical protein